MRGARRVNILRERQGEGGEPQKIRMERERETLRSIKMNRI